MKLISVIVPCFNEEAVFPETLKRLTDTMSELPTETYDFELIFVNDGSKDQTLQLIKQAAQNNQRIKCLNFSRNFGHQLAITAGLDHCQGDAAIVIDADLQDPPSIMLAMIEKWSEGFDVVFGKRKDREGESGFKLWTAKYFYKIINRLSDVDIPKDTGDFRLMDRQALNQFLKMRESYRFVRGMVAWIGFNQTFVEYDRDSRYAGETKYPLKKMIGLASDAILSFSNTPLKIATFVGFLTSVAAFVGIVYSLYIRLFTKSWVEGWTFLMIAILLIGGIILLVLGIIGGYVGRIYGEIKQRPLYIVKDKIGF
ncbi:MAG: glycosyltransferase family 2 protein [Bacteroidota bacterium]|nr:glycosyltransferase family 2 protein [Bacteroidota bacterium]